MTYLSTCPYMKGLSCQGCPANKQFIINWNGEKKHLNCALMAEKLTNADSGKIKAENERKKLNYIIANQIKIRDEKL